MTCRFLHENNCTSKNVGHCGPWLEWSKTSNQDNHAFCLKQPEDPLTKSQAEHIGHVIYNGLTPIQNYLFLLKDYPAQKENFMEYMDRCEAAIDALKNRLKEMGI